MPGNIAMVSLVNTKDAEKMGWGFVCSGASFTLPKKCCKVVGFAEDCPFPGIKVMGNDIKVKEATC